MVEAKQEAQLVTQVRRRKGKQKKIKREERWIQTQTECMKITFKGLINRVYRMPFLIFSLSRKLDVELDTRDLLSIFCF